MEALQRNAINLIMARIEVIDYTENYRKDIILALVALQEHEHSLSNTRKAASHEVGEQALNEIQRDCNNKNGALLIALKDQQFAGLVAYHYESTSLSYETDDSNNYALISNICMLPTFRSLGTGQSLLLAVEEQLVHRGFHGRLRISSLANNKLAIAAYERFGFNRYEIVFEKHIQP